MKKKDDVNSKKKNGDRGELFPKKKVKEEKYFGRHPKNTTHTHSHTHKYVHTGTNFFVFLSFEKTKKNTHTL